MNRKSHIVHFSKKVSKNTSSREHRSLPVLVKNIQSIFVELLEAKLVDMLNSADDRLFDMAESSYNNAQFDAMRLLRIKREGLITSFKHALNNNFSQTITNNEEQIHEDNIESLSFENIALVKDDDLEEDIATDSMVSKAKLVNSGALEQIRTRLDTLVSDISIEAENNPLEPAYICDAFREATGTLDIDIGSLLVIYKLFDRSVVSQLDSIYQKVNEFFVEKGILPELRSSQLTDNEQNRSSTKNIQNIVENMSVSEASSTQEVVENAIENSGDESGVLSVLHQLLSNNRQVSGNNSQNINPIGDSQAPISNVGTSAEISGINTSHIVQALSNIQIQQATSAKASSHVTPDQLRKSLGNQLPKVMLINGDKNDVSANFSKKELGSFNEDMIDIVSMLFDFILEDDNLQPEIKSIIGRLQIPILKVGLVDKTFFSNRRHSARVLLNELAHAGLSWDKNDKTAVPMFEKISSIAEKIIQDFTDDTSIFDQQLKEFLEFKKHHQQRAVIFEKRTKEAERGKAKAESARSEVNRTLSEICQKRRIPEPVKKLLKSVWSHAMLLERLKNNEEGWSRRVKVAKLLVWSVQPVDKAKGLEKLISKIPLLVKSLKEGAELISFSQLESSHLFEELEACHREIIDKAKKMINEQGREDILRLPAIDVKPFNKTYTSIEAPLVNENNEIGEEVNQSNLIDEPIVIEDLVIEDVGFTRIETGELLEKKIIEPVEIDQVTCQTVEQLRAGSWVELKIDSVFKRCKLAARIESSGKYIFVNRSGLKMAEFLTDELCQSLQLGNMKILDDDALFDRALESVISNLRSMKAQA